MDAEPIIAGSSIRSSTRSLLSTDAFAWADEAAERRWTHRRIALGEADLDRRRGSLLVRRGKGGRAARSARTSGPENNSNMA